MLTIWTDKIKHSTVGSSFRVTFSVAPNELEYLNKLYDCFNSMNWSSFPITADCNSSENPNNCEHITEDGVTCAKYPACDYCLDNPLNKVKGSERLLKGKTVPTISKMEQVEDEPQTYVINPQEPTNDDKCFDCDDFFTCGGQCNKIEDEPQTNKDFKVTYTCSFTDCDNFKNFGFGEKCIECKRKQSEAKYKDEPQTERSAE